MKKILLAITFFISFHGYSQKYYLKFISPSIIGPSTSPAAPGSFEIIDTGYEIISTEGKVKPGLLRFSIQENQKLPEIWNIFNNATQPIDIEIYNTILINSQQKVILTLKISNSYINAITFKSDITVGGYHALEIWISQISFQYKEYGVNGNLINSYSTGWDFKTNKVINF